MNLKNRIKNLESKVSDLKVGKKEEMEKETREIEEDIKDLLEAEKESGNRHLTDEEVKELAKGLEKEEHKN